MSSDIIANYPSSSRPGVSYDVKIDRNNGRLWCDCQGWKVGWKRHGYHACTHTLDAVRVHSLNTAVRDQFMYVVTQNTRGAIENTAVGTTWQPATRPAAPARPAPPMPPTTRAPRPATPTMAATISASAPLPSLDQVRAAQKKPAGKQPLFNRDALVMRRRREGPE